MGSIYKGSTKVNKLYFGSKAIQKVYKGSTLIWSAGEQTYIVYKGKNPWVKSNWIELTESTTKNTNYGYVVMPYTYDDDEYATVFPIEAFIANNTYKLSRFDHGYAREFWYRMSDCLYSGYPLDIVKTLDLNEPEEPIYDLYTMKISNTNSAYQKYWYSDCIDYIGYDNFLDSIRPPGTTSLYDVLPNIFMIYQMWQRRKVLYHFLYEVYASKVELMWIGYYRSEDSWDNLIMYLGDVLRETEFTNVGAQVDWGYADGDGDYNTVIPFYQRDVQTS